MALPEFLRDWLELFAVWLGLTTLLFVVAILLM